MSDKSKTPAPQGPKKTDDLPVNGRISKGMRRTLTIMAEQGLDAREAAIAAGFKPDSAIRALRRPHVKRAFSQMVNNVRDNAAQGAYLRINHMSKTADSERTRLEANRWVAGVDGISPVQKVEGNHRHNVTFGGFEYSGPEPVDVTPENSESPDDEA